MHRHLPLFAAIAAGILTPSLAGVAMAAAPEPALHKLGDHPAVVVQRLQRQAGYDYASKFYPHPAGLRLHAAQPQHPVTGPAVDAQAPANSAAQIARR
jgi:hypothetical protein